MKSNYDVYDLALIKEEPKKMAHLYAEGNMYLEELLNISYEKGLETYACCAGHPGKEYNCPYIGYIIRDKNEFNKYVEVLYIASKVFDECYVHLSEINGDLRLTIYIDEVREDRKKTDEIFSYLTENIRDNNITNNKEYELVKSYLKFYDYVTSDRNNDDLRHFDMKINKQEIIFNINDYDIEKLSGKENKLLEYLLSNVPCKEHNHECYVLKNYEMVLDNYVSKHFILRKEEFISIVNIFLNNDIKIKK